MIDIYDLWFSNLKIGNSNKIKLLNKYENSKNIWNLKEENLKENNISKNVLEEILDYKKRINLEKYIDYIENKKIKLISFKSKEYPNILKNIINFPAYLYVRGNINNLYEDCVAIVGSRIATEYGKYISRKISKEIADKNVNVVSGLAIGIDKYAHLGALDSKIGKTIAVLGTGIADEEIYPYENKKIFERILENNRNSYFRIQTWN